MKGVIVLQVVKFYSAGLFVQTIFLQPMIGFMLLQLQSASCTCKAAVMVIKDLQGSLTVRKHLTSE